eukprot:TRINITY_DN78052_c0_g1_i1.p1 TRINITY_DN78052_c0_g1~~TRINITY_DN78052_c0_g1_i1.p1  ORF type:complete len:227 (-),score=47.17 TRINITY_DN78052_c0_g1_i1:168-848(-)
MVMRMPPQAVQHRRLRRRLLVGCLLCGVAAPALERCSAFLRPARCAVGSFAYFTMPLTAYAAEMTQKMAWAAIDDGESASGLDLDYATPASSAFEMPDGKTIIEAIFASLTLLALWAPAGLSNLGAENVTHRRREVSHILVEEESLAQELLTQIKGAGATAMGGLAKRHSVCASKSEFGHLEEVQASEMPAEFTKICFDPEQPTGVPIGPVKTVLGYHIIMLTDKA